jgi:uncharacterized protein
MSIDMYQASVPQFLRMLGNLKGILEKAAAHAAAKKIDESALLGARLFPDMFPLTRQVQIATDFARGTSARLSGVEPPAVEDKEQSFADLAARADVAIAYIKTLPAAKFEGAETRQITRKVRGVDKSFAGTDYLFQYSLPNFYFHLTTTYAILRHNGVEIGKGDFVGSFA